MHRIDGAGATLDNKFTQGNPATATPATTVTDAWLNDVQEELISILLAAGIAPVKGSVDQVLRAMNLLNGRVVDSIAALKALDKTKSARALVTGYYAAADGGGGQYQYDAADTTSADNGGTVIVAADGGRWKLATQGVVSARQFGAKGDGSTNDSVALQAALTWSVANNRSLRVPAGTYIASNLTFNSTAAHITIFGDGSGNTILKNTLDTNPVLTITGSPNQLVVKGVTFSGNGTVTNWGSGNGAAGNNLVGSVATTVASLRLVDLVHATFDDCYFTNSIWGVDAQGGIGLTFRSCYAYWNKAVGFRLWKNTGGYPNLIALRDSHAKENGEVGIYFDQGRQLILDGCDIEGNGKNTTIATTIACGLYVGSLTGVENGAANGPNGGAFHAFGVSVSNCWFEQNGNNNGSGVPNGVSMAHIVSNHGYLSIDSCTLTNATAGRHIRVNGGQYKIEATAFESALNVATNYVDEGAASGIAALVGKNVIANCFVNTAGASANLTAANCTTDPSKTNFEYAKYPQKRIQTGTVTTSGGTAAVTFPTAFTTLGAVQCQVVTNDGGTTTYSAEVYGASATGFTVRAKQNAGGTVTMPAITVMWTAVGD